MERINPRDLLSPENPVVHAWMYDIQPQAGLMGVAQKVEEKRLRRAAYTDELTGLPNRRAFYEAIDEKIEEMQRDPSKKYALVSMDLDRFKPVNDLHGHGKGDEFLSRLGNKFANLKLREGELIARVGGDEFVALIDTSYHGNGLRKEHRPEVVVEGFVTRGLNIVESVSTELSEHDGVVYDVSASIGYEIYEPGMTGDRWVAGSDQNMYIVKRSG